VLFFVSGVFSVVRDSVAVDVGRTPDEEEDSGRGVRVGFGGRAWASPDRSP
jgi:hypothetical protein